MPRFDLPRREGQGHSSPSRLLVPIGNLPGEIGHERSFNSAGGSDFLLPIGAVDVRMPIMVAIDKLMASAEVLLEQTQ
ncbi:hypothetical protein [Cupriavidus necator]|uniref:hypothetical protein n=1 Tax=Cupriavidus necator TaxID=106590 RepID=UPI0030F482AD